MLQVPPLWDIVPSCNTMRAFRSIECTEMMCHHWVSASMCVWVCARYLLETAGWAPPWLLACCPCRCPEPQRWKWRQPLRDPCLPWLQASSVPAAQSPHVSSQLHCQARVHTTSECNTAATAFLACLCIVGGVELQQRLTDIHSKLKYSLWDC